MDQLLLMGHGAILAISMVQSGQLEAVAASTDLGGIL